MEPLPASLTERPSLGRTFQALRYRDYRIYWMALVVSFLGLAFQNVAQRWLVYDLTKDTFKLGVVSFIAAVVATPASLVGGLLADRLPRRNLLIVTQALMMLPPMGLAWLIWAGRVEIWHIVVASAALNTIAAIDLPSRNSLVPQLVGPDDLLNAQSLSSGVYQVALMIGPAIAGYVIAVFGPTLCFLVNGISYGAMVIALTFIRPTPTAPRARRQGARASLGEGFRYILKTPTVLGLFGLIAAQGLFVNPYIYTILPEFADKILKTDARGFGWLNTAAGVGALLGVLVLINLGKGQRRGPLIVFGGLCLTVALVALAWLPYFAISIICIVLLGLGTVFITTISNTLLQLTVPDEIRGRVNSLGLLLFLGGPQIGGLIFGWITRQTNASLALSLMAGAFGVSLLLINVITPQVRHIE